jgi:hypothetical protein
MTTELDFYTQHGIVTIPKTLPNAVVYDIFNTLLEALKLLVVE